MADEPARASLIDGKAFSQTLVGRVAAAAARLEAAHGVKPGLAVVIVGEDPASQLYVRNKGETTLKAGMRSDTHRLPDTTTQDELLALIASLNAEGWWPTELKATSNPYIGDGSPTPAPGDFSQTRVGDATDTSPYITETPKIGISTGTYIENMAALIKYVTAG